MITFCQKELDKYKENDWILRLMEKNTSPEEEKIRTNEWMKTMENKRFIYSVVYGDFLTEGTSTKVLDASRRSFNDLLILQFKLVSLACVNE